MNDPCRDPSRDRVRARIRTRVRIASLVHDRLAAQPCELLGTPLPTTDWLRLLRLRRQLAHADARGWNAPRREILRRIHATLDDLQQRLQSYQSRAVAERTLRPAALADVVRDLEALEEEFPSVELTFRPDRITVETEPVELDGHDLGPFRIVLDLADLQEAYPYQVIAVDPRPSGINPDVPHPHVSGVRLCEGEGRQALRHALRTGRLLDFFVLVRQVLNTYNDGSAYVRLDEWEGIACHDCGVSVESDMAYGCTACGGNLCGDCALSCRTCDESFCGGCLTDCQECDESFCRSCVRSCADCDRRCCRECLDEEERCDECRKLAATEDDLEESPETAPETPPPPGTAIYPGGVGQAPVAAGCGTDGSGGLRDCPL